MASKEVAAHFPPKLEFLFKPSRYKVAYGGRGAAKSWGFARALLIQGAAKKLRIPCCREIQTSIADSVHQLLRNQVTALGLDGFYNVRESYIEGKNGTLFTFHGLRQQSVASIKSLEGADICWVEEGQAVTKRSWEILVPTIRADHSEIWVSYNPELAEDETHQRFVIHPQPDSVVVKMNWSDNPWFPEVLERERVSLKERDPDAYLNIWEGHCRQAMEGAVYADQLREAQASGRIKAVGYDPALPVHTVWDLGFADSTSIWFVQAAPMEYRLIDFVQDSQKPLTHYLATLQSKGYVYGTDWLPHDARARHMESGKSIQELMTAAGRSVQIVPNLGLTDGINAARTIFPLCWFDETKCADGLHALRHYRFEVDPESRQLSARPLHDEHSHASDAFRYFAVAVDKMRVSKSWAAPIKYPKRVYV